MKENKFEKLNCSSISDNTDKSQYETHDNDEVIVITPMEKQEIITLEYAVSYLFSGIVISDNPTFKQILKMVLRLFKVMLLFPIYSLYALTVLDERLDPKFWFILIVPFGSYWLYKCIPLILILLLK